MAQEQRRYWGLIFGVYEAEERGVTVFLIMIFMLFESLNIIYWNWWFSNRMKAVSTPGRQKCTYMKRTKERKNLSERPIHNYSMSPIKRSKKDNAGLTRSFKLTPDRTIKWKQFKETSSKEQSLSWATS